MLNLKPKEIELLIACLMEHRPDLLWVVDSPHIVNLDHSTQEYMCDENNYT
jgi:hypothetical protein